jgi:hypothetical protein
MTLIEVDDGRVKENNGVSNFEYRMKGTKHIILFSG